MSSPASAPRFRCGARARRAAPPLATVAAVFMGSAIGAQEAPILAHEAERIQEAGAMGAVSAVHLGPDGLLYASVPGDRGFRVVDPADGSLQVLTIGDIAPSPIPRFFGWTGDTLWAADWLSTRIVRFGEEGDPVEEQEVILPGSIRGVRALRVLALLPEGRLVVQTSAGGTPTAVAHPGGVARGAGNDRVVASADSVRHLPLWITDERGTVRDTLALLSTRNTWSVYLSPGDSGAGRWKQRVQLFRDDPLHAIDPLATRVVIVDRSVHEDDDPPSYTVHRVDVLGDTLESAAYPHEPAPLPAERVEEELRYIGSDLSEDLAEGIEVARQGLYLPAWLPPVSHVVVDADGWIWVGREAAPGSLSRRWDVLDPEGVRIGSVLLPPELTVRAVDGLQAWALEEAPRGEDTGLWHVRAFEEDSR